MTRATPAVLVCVAALGAVVLGCASPAPAPATQPSAITRVVEKRWPSGLLRLRKEVLLDAEGNEVNHGLYEEWHDHGQRAYEVHFVHGQKDGVARRWHKNGRLWTEETYVHGRKHGTCCTWDEDGAKRKEEQYADGQPDGTWTIWDAKGEIEAQSHFDHGRPVP
jgi:hypothetical protein